MSEYPSSKHGVGQIGSHLGNTGPFWQIRVPLGKLGSHWAKLRVHLRSCGSHPGKRCNRGYVQGGNGVRSPSPRSTCGVPLTTLRPFSEIEKLGSRPQGWM